MTINITAEHVEDLARQGCFVAVHVRRPSLRTQIRWNDLGLDVDDSVMSAPSTKPPSAAFNVFARIEQRLRTKLDAAATGNAGGLRFMRWTTYERFSVEADSLCADYMDAVEPFLVEYERDVEEAIARWRETSESIYRKLTDVDVDLETFTGRLVAHLRATWPSADRLRPRFACSYDVLNFTLPTAETMKASPEIVRAAREQASSTLRQFFAEAQIELRASVVEAVQRVHHVLTTSETITDRSILPLREVIARFRELSVVGDGAFLDALKRVEDALQGDAARLRNDTSAWAQARETLAQVAQEAERLVVEDSHRPMRRIRVESTPPSQAA